ncbi:MAG: hypothetical protein VKK04_03815 [Synechococcales bacterium]|nr:hypothetical protein [Synechococcales bacterium]
MKQVWMMVGPILGSLLLAGLIVSATTNYTSVPPLPEEGDRTAPVSQTPVSQTPVSQTPPSPAARAEDAAPRTTPVVSTSGSDPTVVATPPDQATVTAANPTAAANSAAASGNAPEIATANQGGDRPLQEEGFPRPAQILGATQVGTNCRANPWGDIVGGLTAGATVTAERWQADDRGEPWFYVSSPQLPQGCWVHDSRIQLASTAIQPDGREAVASDSTRSRDSSQAVSQTVTNAPDRAVSNAALPRQGRVIGDADDDTNCRHEPWGEVVATLAGGGAIAISDRTTDADGATWFRVTTPQVPDGCWIHSSRIAG